ncbi:hypothetical protein swp_0909 [Shewanella piezotolerans WP3]|uniref:Uncharacterized protein n=1 Tax=Shewanella piezotolerans (strain WP3 / JCM 13877) TaxID=225849 RepID=B8CK12_SHEPW|nr:hypothetical protein swp_0909 [Shewanella piezotolerans WP3]
MLVELLLKLPLEITIYHQLVAIVYAATDLDCCFCG